MRATDGLQTIITVSPVKDDGQAFSLDLSLRMSLPMPQPDEHLPDQIEAYVHQSEGNIKEGACDGCFSSRPRRFARSLISFPSPSPAAVP
jgi:hypothetical protein